MTPRREWLVALAIAFVALALAQIPYALGYAFARPGFQFTGILMNPEDAQSYFAKMLQGFDGAWLYTIPFMTEDHAPAFLGGFYLLLGRLARVLGLSLETMWHAARVVCDLGLFLATFDFIARFTRDPSTALRTRALWTAYLLALFGSGLGWILFLLNQPYWLDWFPVDFKMPEAHLFFTALTFPHSAFGTTMLLVSLGAVERALTRASWRAALTASIANLALAIAYPFLIYLVIATTALYWLMLAARARRILWREALLAALTWFAALPLLVYYAFTLATNPVMRAWDAQAITLSPPLPHYLLAFGVMLLLALLTARRHSDFTLLWAWLIAAALLVYAPLNPQRRFVQGAHIPLAILATVGWLEIVLPRLTRTRAFQSLSARPNYSVAGLERLLTIFFLGAMSVSNVYVLASTALTATIEQPYPLFRPRGDADAIAWLRANTTRDQVVLGTYEAGNYVAARAGNRVVVGHWAETLDWQTKFDATEKFFGAADDDWRRDFLARYRVEYVLFDQPAQFDPTSVAYLVLVLDAPGAKIYRVR
jgi:hypothetical protein